MAGLTLNCRCGVPPSRWAKPCIQPFESAIGRVAAAGRRDQRRPSCRTITFPPMTPRNIFPLVFRDGSAPRCARSNRLCPMLLAITLSRFVLPAGRLSAQDLDAKPAGTEPDRMLAYYRIRAGLGPLKVMAAGTAAPAAHRPHRGHYLSAVSFMWAATSVRAQRASRLHRERTQGSQDKQGDGYSAR